MKDPLLEYALSLWRDEYWKDGNHDKLGDVLRIGNSGYIRLFAKRTFVLKDQTLFYFRRRMDKIPLGAIFLDAHTRVNNDCVHSILNTKTYTVTLFANTSCSVESKKMLSKRTYVLTMESEESQKQWYRILLAATGNQEDQTKHATEQFPRSFTPPNSDNIPFIGKNFPNNTLSPQSMTAPLAIPQNVSHESSRASSQYVDAEERPTSPVSLKSVDLSPSISSSNKKDLGELSTPFYSVMSTTICLLDDYLRYLESCISSNNDPISFMTATREIIVGVRSFLGTANTTIVQQLVHPALRINIDKQAGLLVDRAKWLIESSDKLDKVVPGEIMVSQVQDLFDRLTIVKETLKEYVRIIENASQLDHLSAESEKGHTLDEPTHHACQAFVNHLCRTCIELAELVNDQDKGRYHTQFKSIEDLAVIARQVYIRSQSEIGEALHFIMQRYPDQSEAMTRNERFLNEAQKTISDGIDELTKATEMADSAFCSPYAHLGMASAAYHLCISVTRLILTVQNTQDRIREVSLDEDSMQIQAFQPFWQSLLQVTGTAERSSMDGTTHEQTPISPGSPLRASCQITQLKPERSESPSSTIPVRSYSSSVHSKLQSSPASQMLKQRRNRSLSLQQSSVDVSRYELQVNRVVAVAVDELLDDIVQSCAAVRGLLRAEFPTSAVESPEELKIRQETLLSITNFVANSIAQIEEELGALERSTCKCHLLYTVDDARCQLSRANTVVQRSIHIFADYWAENIAACTIEDSLNQIDDAATALSNAVSILIASQREMLSELVKSCGSPVRRGSVNCSLSNDSTRPATEEEVKGLEEFERYLLDELNDLYKSGEILLRDSNDQSLVSMSNDVHRLVKAGTLKRLVECLTWHKVPSAEYMIGFLFTYTTFTTGQELLSLLIARYNEDVPHSMLKSEEAKRLYRINKVVPVRLRVFNVLKAWIKFHYADFGRDEKLLASLKEFLPTLSDAFHKGTSEIRALLDRRARGDEMIATTDRKQVRSPHPMLPKNISSAVSLSEFDPLEIARQLTLLQWKLYKNLTGSELLDKIRDKCPPDQNRDPNTWKLDIVPDSVAPNLRKMMDLCNFLVLLIETEIIRSSQAKSRAVLIRFWISVGENLRVMKNFDGLMAVCHGLKATGIARLRRTWECVPTKVKQMFAQLESLISESKNYQNLRIALQCETQAIPFLGMYLTDLTKIEIGNKDFTVASSPSNQSNTDNIEEKDKLRLINIQKRMLLSGVIRDLCKFQTQPPPNLEWVPRIHELLHAYEPLNSDEQVYNMSLELEPRGSNLGSSVSTSSYKSSREALGGFLGTGSSGRAIGRSLKLGGTMSSSQSPVLRPRGGSDGNTLQICKGFALDVSPERTPLSLINDKRIPTQRRLSNLRAFSRPRSFAG